MNEARHTGLCLFDSLMSCSGKGKTVRFWASGRGLSIKRHDGTFCDDGNILKLNYDGGYLTILQRPVQLKGVYCTT